MKNIKYILVGIAIVLSLVSCKDEWELERDNPIDGKNSKEMKSGAALAYDNYYIYADSNDDKHISKGEKVKLNVAIKNTGEREATDVKVTFFSNSLYISDFRDKTPIAYGNIAAGGTAWKYGYSKASNYAIEFRVSSSAPTGAIIPFTLKMQDNKGNSWESTFSITVEDIQAQLSYDSYYVYSDNNSDKEINKGEKISLNVSLKNTGASRAKGVKATFSCNSSYITGLQPTSGVPYTDIEGGASQWKYGWSKTSDYALKFEVSKDTPANTIIPFSINITDEAGNSWQSTFNITVKASSARIVSDSYYIFSDDNDDNIVNKGETIKLNVSLKNIGESTANYVKATFSCNSAAIFNFSREENAAYGSITPNSSSWYRYSKIGSYVIAFTIRKDVATNTVIPITAEVSDENGNTWTSTFDVAVKPTAANIVYANHYVLSEYHYNEGTVRRGDLVKINVALKNNGTSRANDVEATFETNSPYALNFSSTPAAYNAIYAGSTVWKESYPKTYKSALQFTIANYAPVGTKIPIRIRISDGNGNQWTDSFDIIVQ